MVRWTIQVFWKIMSTYRSQREPRRYQFSKIGIIYPSFHPEPRVIPNRQLLTSIMQLPERICRVKWLNRTRGTSPKNIMCSKACDVEIKIRILNVGDKIKMWSENSHMLKMSTMCRGIYTSSIPINGHKGLHYTVNDCNII